MTREEPRNLEAERSLLGAMLLSRDAIDAAADAVTADEFFRPVHGFVFDAVLACSARGEKADPVTVGDELARRKQLDSVGGLSALLEFQGATPATSNAGRYARIVADHAAMRRIVVAAREVANAAYDAPDDVEALAAEAVRLLEDAGPRALSEDRLSTWPAALSGWLDRLEARAADVRLAGEPTGWRDVDALVAGLRPGQLVIVGGRPSMGKSDVLVSLACNLSSRNVPTLYVSLEMTAAELHDRVGAQMAQVDRDRIRRGTLDEPSWMRLSSRMGRMAEAALWIADEPGAGLGTVTAAARRVARATGRMPVVIVDYLQLMSSGRRGENRQVEVAEMSRGFKRAAGELRTTIVAASQLGRKVEERAEKHPLLSDLRESGSLEQDSDVVILLYRPEAYDPKSERRGEMDLIVAKQRNGPKGTARMLYDERTGRLRDRPEEDRNEPLAMPLDGSG